jgi:hypothetical protein
MKTINSKLFAKAINDSDLRIFNGGNGTTYSGTGCTPTLTFKGEYDCTDTDSDDENKSVSNIA